MRAATEARRSAESEIAALKTETREIRTDLERREARLGEREGRLDSEAARLETRDRSLAESEAELQRRRDGLDVLEAERLAVLERVAGLTAADAKAELLASIEQQAKRDAAVLVRDIEAEAREDG